jgi:hypothetical protein
MDPEGKQRAKVKIVAEHIEFKTAKPGEKGEESPGSLAQETEEAEDSGRPVVF